MVDYVGSWYENRTSLHPYYTGIDLHTSNGFVIKVTFFCLNPYYTGIDLHANWSATERYNRMS